MSDDLVKRLRLGACELEIEQAADRIEELEADLEAMKTVREWLGHLRGEAEYKLAKAIEALDEAVYLLDPDDEDIAKETGLHRIVTTLAELREESRG